MNDLISRQAAIDAIKRYESAYNYDLNNGLILAMNAVADVPTIDPVKHGKWIDVMTEEWCTFDECKCSVCGVVEYFNKGWKKFSYCPHCGAKMMRGDDED